MSYTLIHTLVLIPVWVLNSWLAIALYKRRQTRREVKFLKQVKIIHPNSTILFTAVETSDAEALNSLRAQLEES